MSSFADRPNLVAGGNIYPYRGVAISTTADNTGVQGTATITDKFCGFTEGSTRRQDSSYHAIANDQIVIQGGGVVWAETGAAIASSGLYLSLDAQGKVITATSGTTVRCISLQSAAATGEIIRVWIGATVAVA